jgi:CRISPR-associated endonuclease Csn1
MKRVLGLDLGTNSIGWALVEQDFEEKKGNILGLGSRIIPMPQDVLGKFDAGQSISQTAERTKFRGVRRLYQRDNLRRERLHRVLNIIGFLPKHYAEALDFETKLGQFKRGLEVKLNYFKNSHDEYEFLFKESFLEMLEEFRERNPDLFRKKEDGAETKIPYDWTIYFLRKKALKEKISKEELAWLILNFNQKRGYYQLRGEEETDKEKEKEYCLLKVEEIKDTGEKIKGNTLYDVFFDNGWKYDKQITKRENWVNKTKEFIVTTSKTKNGETKRTFKVVDSENDWIAIKKKTEKDIILSEKSVGEYILENLLQNPKQKIRGKLIRTIERKFYKVELENILKEQTKHHPELQSQNLYRKCIEELYPRNEAHQNTIKEKNFEYLFIEDIIFYQRPLKSKKSTITNCKFETKTYEIDGVEIKKSLKAIPKSNPLYQEFRLLQWIKNLRILRREQVIDKKLKLDFDVTYELFYSEKDLEELYQYLNTKKEIDQNQILKYLIDKGTIPKDEIDNYRWNYVEDKKYPCNETRTSFVTRLKKIKGIDANAFLTNKVEYNLWHIVYSVKDKTEFKKALGTFAQKNRIDKEDFVSYFEKFPVFKNEYGAYSEKALKKLLPLMRFGENWNEKEIDNTTKVRIGKIITGEYDETIKIRTREKAIELKKIENFQNLPIWLAEYIVYDRHSETGNNLKWSSPHNIDNFLDEFKQHSLRNPIVEQVITETLRVVKDIWNQYGNGKENYFDEIHIELGREMKNPAEIRKAITQRQQENENTNQRIKELLKELAKVGARESSPSHQEILKVYEEGVFQNPDAQYKNVSEDDILKIRRNSSPTQTEIQKYRLWLEQGYRSPYTGEVISLSELFSTKYQIEHIIPQSRYFDNSLSNKVICESDINPYPYKDNQTGYEFIKNQGGTVIPELSSAEKIVKIFTKEEYEFHCKRYFRKNRVKQKKLLSDEIPENFLERQLNDSRYISKYIKGVLSNIVMNDEEEEATSKNIVPVTGAITAHLKKDWGLNDKWNEIITPRFERMNELTKSKNYGFWDNNINAFRIQVSDDIYKGFSKKRIDHRHHAMDALVIACCTKDHINYITSLNTSRRNYGLVKKLRKIEEIERKNKRTGEKKKIKVPKSYHKPWDSFPIDAKEILDKTIISFKQNNRVINKTNNKTWQWVEEKGQLKKKLIKQEKGDNWSIRKPLHKETVYGKLDWAAANGKVITANRVSLSEIKTEKHLEKVTDSGIKIILENHLKNYINQNGKSDFEAAFSSNGIEELNKNIISLNSGKYHQPIFKVRLFEEGLKFSVGSIGNKDKKYVEAEKGTNLFFTVYWNERKQKREFETIPLFAVIDHQKERAAIKNKIERDQIPMIPINKSKGDFLFSLSPNDLVYVPTDEEMEYPHYVNFDALTNEQVGRIYRVVSSSKTQCFFIKNEVANSIKNKVEFSSLNKMEKSINGVMIKEVCWKLIVDRLGNVIKVGDTN